MTHRSHTKQEIRDAVARGAQVWVLDTGSDGEDDILIGNREDVFQDICAFHQISELLPRWNLKPFQENVSK